MNHHSLLRPTLNAAVALAIAGAAQAAVAAISIDLALDPPKVIDATSLQFGVGVGIGTAVGTTREREFSAPSLSDIVWSQALDTTYPGLLGRTLTGKITDKAKIDLQSPSGIKPYLSLTAERAGLTGVSLANTSVSGSMDYEKLTMTYDPDGLGKRGSQVTTSYDLSTGKTNGDSSRSATIFAGTTPAASGGGTEIYLRLGSGATAIAGESTAAGYENWIRIDSVQMGVGMVFSAVGSGGTRVAGTPSISELTLTQQFDSTIPVVFSALLRGAAIGDATIEYVTDAGAGPVTFMQLVLDNVMFSGLSLSTGGELPSVSESLNFTGFSQTVWEIDEHGERVAFTSAGYDITKGKNNPGRLAANVSGFGTGNLGNLVTSAASGAAGPVAAPIPEPGSWLMMLGGLGVLAGVARRRASA